MYVCIMCSFWCHDSRRVQWERDTADCVQEWPEAKRRPAPESHHVHPGADPSSGARWLKGFQSLHVSDVGQAVTYVFFFPTWPVRIFSEPICRHVHKRETVSRDRNPRGHHQGRFMLHVIKVFINHVLLLRLSCVSQRSGSQTDEPSGGGKPSSPAAHTVRSIYVLLKQESNSFNIN